MYRGISLTKLVVLHMTSVFIQSVVLLFVGTDSSVVSFCDMEWIPIVALAFSLFYVPIKIQFLMMSGFLYIVA